MRSPTRRARSGSDHIDNVLKKLDSAQRKLEANGDRDASIEEIAEVAGVDPEEADVIMRAAQQLVSSRQAGRR